nr:serine protease [uncultured Roseateles sp.]
MHIPVARGLKARFDAVMPVLAALWLAAGTAMAQPRPPAAAAAAASAAEPAAPVSLSAQRLYERTRVKLVQIRTLLKSQSSQASVGSGFLVSDDGLLMTNYHVVSQVALQPERYRLVYTTADGKEGALELLAIDVVHDLALVRANPTELATRGHLNFRPQSQPLNKGERIYSLGNPLDVGFALTEGNYNGLVERSFYPSIFFGGSLNPGMSGGPTLDEEGRVMGINVATRRDGEQISFLVPSMYAEALLARGQKALPIKNALYPEITRQLLEHQQVLVDKFMALPWRSAGHPHYQIPVPGEDFMRCWGSTSASESKGLDYERSDCQLEQTLFITGALFTGGLTVRHETYEGSKLGLVRFTKLFGDSFRNERFGSGSLRDFTAPQCQERFITQGGLPLRVVLCMTAYRKLPGLFDVSVLVATQDQARAGAQGRLDARGLSFANAMRLSRHYLEGFAWKN